jgi:hypothetical protein
MKVDVVLFYRDGNYRDVATVAFARTTVECPRVPGTHDRMFVQGSVGERRAAMRAIPL